MPARRLAIHRRNYHASLMAALATKFPATAWLMGPAAFTDAAGKYVTARPPRAPCIAEYGEDFPTYVAHQPISARAPYLASVAEADWHLGQVSIAVSETPLPIAMLASLPEDRLPDIRLTLQPGLRFLVAEWPIDRLIALHLGDNPPDQFVLEREAVRLQFRGARGKFDVERLGLGAFAFRRALAAGGTLGAASESALAEENDFDPGAALATLFGSGLVVRAPPLGGDE
jgi:hypothetical protein